MSLFEQLSRQATLRGLRFLVIGGHAVMEHGFQRGTDDADILVCNTDRSAWLEIVGGLGYKLFRDGGNFVQFESREADQWNLDLMLATEDTFNRLLAAAQQANLEGAAVVVPSLEHLLALKIHALKHGRGLRALKDMTDVAQLMLVNRIDPNPPGWWRCSRSMATWNFMSESLGSSLNEPSTPYRGNALEFPDWSGHLPPRRRASKDQWLAYCRSNLPKLRQLPGYRDARLQDGISVEFVL